MEPQLIVNALLAATGFGVVWWVNNVWAMVRSLQQQVSALDVELARNYAPRAELQDTFNRIFGLLEEIRKEVRHQS